MKRKLLTALLATAAVTVVASVVPTAATTDTWGTDSVWMEGEDTYADADTVLAYGTVGNNIPWQITADGTLTVGTVGDTGSYSIPDWDDPSNYGDDEDEINKAFTDGKLAPWLQYRDDVATIVIGDDISYIGNNSFRNFSNVEELTIPGTVKIVGEHAFQNCDKLKTLTIKEGVKELRTNAFDSCPELTTVDIPASVTYFSSDAFNWCDKLYAININKDNQNYVSVDGVVYTKDKTELLRYPIAKKDVTSYEVPDTVTYIWNDCFECVDALKSITLPDGLEEIGFYSFSYMDNLTSITIPASVTTIEHNVFYNDTSLTDVYFRGDRPNSWGDGIFYGNEGHLDLTIHYPASGERWGDICEEYGDHMEVNGGYKVRFVDDDGITDVRDEQILDLNATITVPAAPDHSDYGTFQRWCAQNRDYTTTDTTMTLTQDLLDEAAYDTNNDGVNDTIIFEAEYDIHENASEFRAEGWIDTNDDGTDDIHWFVEWNRNLTVESASNDFVSIPDYPDCYDNPNAERAPWHEYANYIRSINLWGNINSIGNYAFADLYMLEGFTIPGDVESVGLCAFIGCTNVGWIDIQEGVKTIEHDVFCSIDMDNGLWLPASATEIDDNAFLNMRVNSFEVDENNRNYWSDEQGIFYKKNEDDTSTLLNYPKNSWVHAVVIPEGVTVIHESAFEDANGIYSIQLPESLKTIEKNAFRSLDLNMIHIRANVTSIGDEAFKDNGNLWGAYFYSNAPTMGEGVFDDCGYNCDSFGIVYLDGKTGFDNIGYETVSIEQELGHYLYGYMSGNWNDEEIYIEWKITKDGCLNIVGEGSIPDDWHPWWGYQAYVRNVNIDDRITYIGNNVFCDLTHVESIHLPVNVTHIGDGAFCGMGSVATGFEGMNNHIELVLPSTVESIANNAFRNLGITQVTIPASLKEIGSWVFTDNPITTYAVESGSQNFGVDSYGALYELDGNNKVALVAYPRDAGYESYTVPNGVTRLYGASIRNCDNLTSVTLPNTLEVIENEALAHNHSMLTLTIPASVETIYSNAFRWGNKTSVVFLGDMPTFENDGEGEGNQFWDNRDGFTLYYYEGAKGWADYGAIDTYALKQNEAPYLAQGSIDDTIYWNIDLDGVLTVSGSGNIPDYWNDYHWRNNMDLVKEIVIEEGITGIGGRMFEGGSGITGLTLPSTLIYINENAFYSGDGNNFDEVTIPASVRWLDYHAFDGCGITKVTIAGTMGEWDSEAFWGNPITEYAVTEDNEYYTTVDGVLFNKDKTELVRYPVGRTDTSYTVPDSVKVIKDGAFYCAKNLTSIGLPDGLETIEWNAFANAGLKGLFIPSSVNDIKDSAFCNNYNLTDVYFHNKRPDNWEGNLFWLYNEENDENCLRDDFKIHYPACAANWGDITNEYGDHIELTYGYLVCFVDDDGVSAVCGEQILNLNDSFTVPTAKTKEYGNFLYWTAWERDCNMNESSLTLDQGLLNDAAYDSNGDGFNDTIVFEANYNLYDDAGDYRAYGEIDNNDDGENEVWWHVTWDRTLEIGSLTDDMVSIPDYPDCYADDDAYQNAERAPWHEYANYIREINWCGVKDYIGSYAFADLYLLNGVSIPSEVKTIGTCAFIGCTNISWININDGVETIEHDVFCSVDMNNGIWIPASVTNMSDNAFLNCRVNCYQVDSNNENYWNDAQGILYKYNGDGTSTLLAYPKNNGQCAIVIPEGVTTIHESAFDGAGDVIYSVQLPESLTTIEKRAFQTNILNVIHIPASVTSIGDEAFRDNGNFYGAYFYGDAPEMGENVFGDTANNFKVYYLNGKTGFDDIGYETELFSANDNYAEGTINYNWEGEQIDLKWYITKDGWLKVEGNTSIPNHEHPWWEYLAYVRKVDIDDNITYIGNNAFCDLTHVDTINLPKNVKHIGDGAFGGMGSAAEGFRGMNNSIGALVLPGEVESIANNAFCNLGITKVTIPASLQEIGVWVFTDNPITTYAVDDETTRFGVDTYGALYELDENGNKVALVSYPRDAEYTSYTVPSGVTKLYGAAIRNACNLTSITLPDTLEEIGNEAFAHFYNDMRTLTIPDSVKTIYSNAFRWGNKTSVVFLGNMPEFINDGEGEGNQFWDNLDNQIVVYYYEGKTGWKDYNPNDINTYELKKGEEPFVAQGYFWDGWDIQWTIDKNGVLNVYGSGEIPGDWGGYDWHDYDFWDKVKEIEIHEGITGVGAYMFWGSSGLTKLTLPSTLTSIQEYAFGSGYNGNAIGELVLPEGLTYIGDFAFHKAGLTKVTIPSTVDNIESHAFVRNQIQEFVVIEGNDRYSVDEYGVLFEKREHEDEDGNGLGEYFLRLHSYPAGSSLTTYTVPQKLNGIEVGEIGDWAFTNAQNLTKVNLSDIWGIAGGGFLNCDNLTSLELNNMHWLSSEAIFGCDKLTSITFVNRIPEVFTWEDGYLMPFVNNGVNNENDDLVVYYYSDAENLERLEVLRENYTLKELTRTNTKGDVNNDGNVNSDDLKLLQQYFAGYNVNIANWNNADIDGEDGFTRRDVMILARYLDNWGGDYNKYFND